MRTFLILAAGVWLGRRISTVLFENSAKEREQSVRKRLEKFIAEHIPAITISEKQEFLKALFK